MPIAALKLKILPDSPDVDLKAIEYQAEKIALELGCKSFKAEHEEIGFGLKAIILTLAWPEQQEQELIEGKLRKIEHVDSVEVIDFRRALG